MLKPPKPIVVKRKLTEENIPNGLKVDLLIFGLNAITTNRNGLVIAPMQVQIINQYGA